VRTNSTRDELAGTNTDALIGLSPSRAARGCRIEIGRQEMPARCLWTVIRLRPQRCTRAAERQEVPSEADASGRRPRHDPRSVRGELQVCQRSTVVTPRVRNLTVIARSCGLGSRQEIHPVRAAGEQLACAQWCPSAVIAGTRPRALPQLLLATEEDIDRRELVLAQNAFLHGRPGSADCPGLSARARKIR